MAVVLDEPQVAEGIARRGVGSAAGFRWAGTFDAKPFYKTVPKDLVSNLKYRREVLKLAMNDKVAQADLWKRCSRDLLFFVNTFAWVYEPRIPAVLPCITYPFQDEALLAIRDAIAKHDLCIKKSRDMTASWDCLIVLEWLWQFHDMQSFLIVSRNQDLVDKADDPDSLFWKLEFLVKKQPSWLKPAFTKTELRLKNEDNGSTINGASTTGNVGRGGRRTAVLLDEFAAFPKEDSYRALYATQQVTASRIYNSTPQGSANAYFDVAHDQNIRQLELWWPLHPSKSKGLYTSAVGRLRIIDKDYDFPPDYNFILDGKIRSPYYDHECRRTPVPQLIAQELDMDFLGSNFQFFDKQLVDAHEVLYVREPFAVGELVYDLGTAVPKKFTVEGPRKRLRLWLHRDVKGNPPRDREYVIGADVSAGTGASNSALLVGDCQTGELVAEFTSPHIAPHELSVYAAALGYWLADEKQKHLPLIIGEANGGHNRNFQKRLIELGYGNVFYRRNEQSISGKVSDVPGWASTKDNKRELFEDFSRAIGSGDCIVRSAECLGECREYVFMPDGTIDHARSRSTIDPSSARDNHGDRAMAAALCWHAMKRSAIEPVAEPEIPVGSLAFRRAEAKQRSKESVLW